MRNNSICACACVYVCAQQRFAEDFSAWFCVRTAFTPPNLMNCYELNGANLNSSFLQWCLISSLTIWLFFTTARQVFDVVGRLWVPVIFNFFQVLFCVVGLLAAFQNRVVLLVALTASTLLSLAYNVELFLWYEDLLSANLRDNSDLLSAGQPHGHSFFLLYTPFCEASALFNSTTDRWFQDTKQCFLPYYRLESAQATVHALFAIITLTLSVLMLLRRTSAKLQSSKMGYGVAEKVGADSSIRRRTQPNGKNGRRSSRLSNSVIVISRNNSKNAAIQNECFYNDANTIRNENLSSKDWTKASELTSPNSIDDFNRGYMNSPYNSSNCDTRMLQQQRSFPLRLEQQQDLQQQNEQLSDKKFTSNYGSTFKANKRLIESANAALNCAADFENNRSLRNLDNYSAATTVEYDRKSVMRSTNMHGLPQPPKLTPPAPQPLLYNARNELFAQQNNIIAKSQQRQQNGGRTSELGRACYSTMYSEIGTGQNLIETDIYERPLRRTDSAASRPADTQNNSNIRNNNTPGNDFATPAVARIYSSRNAAKYGTSGRYAKMRKANNAAIQQNADYFNKYQQQSLNAFHFSEDSFENQRATTEVCSRSATCTPNQLSHKNNTDEYVGQQAFENDAGQRNSPTNLISFDPKSNTLIRIRKHHNNESRPSTPNDTEVCHNEQHYDQSHHRRSNSQPTHYQQQEQNYPLAYGSRNITHLSSECIWQNADRANDNKIEARKIPSRETQFLTFGNIGNQLHNYIPANAQSAISDFAILTNSTHNNAVASHVRLNDCSSLASFIPSTTKQRGRHVETTNDRLNSSITKKNNYAQYVKNCHINHHNYDINEHTAHDASFPNKHNEYAKHNAEAYSICSNNEYSFDVTLPSAQQSTCFPVSADYNKQAKITVASTVDLVSNNEYASNAGVQLTPTSSSKHATMKEHSPAYIHHFPTFGKDFQEYV